MSWHHQKQTPAAEAGAVPGVATPGTDAGGKALIPGPIVTLKRWLCNSPSAELLLWVLAGFNLGQLCTLGQLTLWRVI
jgi:hypothetical protein